MTYIGVSISGRDIYLSIFDQREKLELSIQKFTLSDGLGESLKDLYNYIELFLSKIEKWDKIILETATAGPRSPSFERLKAEGIFELLLANQNLLDRIVRIKSQKRRKNYEEITKTPSWQDMGTVTYFKKIEQIAAFLLLEEII